jgi:hypothetical protein
MGFLKRSTKPSGAPPEGAAARQGRPEFDLAGWAQRRGLDFRGNSSQAGYFGVTRPWSTDLLFNVVRGRWAGGSYGVLCHEGRLYQVDGSGRFGSGRTISASNGVLDLAVSAVGIPTFGGEGYAKLPYTSAGVRVPHLGSVTGLHVARPDPAFTEHDALRGSWTERPLDGPGAPGEWVAAVRKSSDGATIERLLAGPVRDVLASERSIRVFELRVEYGQAIVVADTYLERDEDLDALTALADDFARGVRDVCLAGVGSRPLSEHLPPPEWLASVQSNPGEPHTIWPIGARLETVVQIATERGLTVEDPGAFHDAFPALNFPGQAFAVLNGRLPGTALDGRLLCCAERPMHIPSELEKLLTDPGGQVGCDVAVLAVDPGVPATVPEGESEEGLRVAVADGVLTAWRIRPRWQADGPALDRLSGEVAATMARRGLN